VLWQVAFEDDAVEHLERHRSSPRMGARTQLSAHRVVEGSEVVHWDSSLRPKAGVIALEN